MPPTPASCVLSYSASGSGSRTVDDTNPGCILSCALGSSQQDREHSWWGQHDGQPGPRGAREGAWSPCLMPPLLLSPQGDDGPDVRGGSGDILLVHATETDRKGMEPREVRKGSWAVGWEQRNSPGRRSGAGVEDSHPGPTLPWEFLAGSRVTAEQTFCNNSSSSVGMGEQPPACAPRVPDQRHHLVPLTALPPGQPWLEPLRKAEAGSM